MLLKSEFIVITAAAAKRPLENVTLLGLILELSAGELNHSSFHKGANLTHSLSPSWHVKIQQRC